ncbi:putative F-box/LRR-repeat protein 23 [Bidens hawaiensis]|uniref:putative F-box/LRR-repeat protein 23 n=1 Tax=Bidens hawaiensis TaxID=980011 RepID=UPI00404983D9
MSSYSVSSRESTNRKRQWQGPARNWLELPSCVMLNILQRVGMHDILENAQKVCTAWRRICKDPALWRVIYMDSFAFPVKRAVTWKMCRNAVDRSQGQLVDFGSYGYACGEVLEYVAQRSSQLRRLEVKVCYGDMCGVWSEVFKNLPLLEELSLAGSYLLPKDIEAAGRYCPLLKTLKVNSRPYGLLYDDDDNEVAFAIGENLPQLTHLALIGNRMENVGLQAILDGCCHLESLDLRLCKNLGLEGDLGERCSQQIKHLKLPHHYFEGYYHVCDECVGSWA